MLWRNRHHSPARWYCLSTEGLYVFCMLNKGSLGRGEDINYISKSFHVVNLKLLYNCILNSSNCNLAC